MNDPSVLGPDNWAIFKVNRTSKVRDLEENHEDI